MHPLRLSIAAGLLNGAEDLYNVAVDKIDSSLPASKAEVQASHSQLEAEFEEYKDQNTAVVDALVGKVNSLTPVCCCSCSDSPR